MRFAKFETFPRQTFAFRFEAKFEIGGLPDDALGFGRVLHTRQLHHDTIATLALDHGLRHPELIDPVAQGRQVLGDRIVFPSRDDLGTGRKIQQITAVRVRGLREQLAKIALRDQQGSPITACRRLKGGDNTPPFHPHELVTGLAARRAQPIAQLSGLGLQVNTHDVVGVYFHKENATPTGKIQAQLHGLGFQVRQPSRRGRCKIERHHIVEAQCLLYHPLGGELLLAFSGVPE